MIKIVTVLFTLCFFTLLNAQISGRVLDNSSKKPLNGAYITILQFDRSISADSLGNFQFSGDFPERLQLRIQFPGYETQLYSVELPVVNRDFELAEKHISLEEVTISGGRQSTQKTSPFTITHRKLADLNLINTTSLTEALSTLPGVYQSTTGIGIGKPVIRGLQGIRVLSLINGLRIENQQWGGDHGLGITELGIGSVEVIKGPSSLMYGSDAMGGVLFFIDEPFAPQRTFKLNFSTQNESNTLGTINQLGLKLSGEQIRFAVYGRFSSHADYKLPDGRFAQNSRFQDQSLKIALGFNQKKYAANLRYTYIVSQIGLPGHTHEAVVTPDEFKVENQERRRIIPVQDFHNHYFSLEQKLFLRKTEVSLLLGESWNDLDEFEDKVTIPGLALIQSNSIAQVKVDHRFNTKLSLVSGIQGMFQVIQNGDNALEYLLPNASQIDAGAFSLLKLELDNWAWQGGVRYDLRQINSLQTGEEFSALKRQFTGFNYALGGVRNFNKYTFRANVSSGFRAPHYSELLSNGVHHGTLRYEVGDPTLEPETANQFDFTAEYHGEHFEVQLNPFYTFFNNFIAISPTDSLIESFPVFKYEQVPIVHMSGVDVALHYHPHFAHRVHIESNYSFIYTETDSGRSLPLMPQNRLSNTVRFSLGMKSIVQLEDVLLQYILHFGQYRTAEFETSSVPYHLIHLSLNGRLAFKQHPIGFKIGVKNVLNSSYIDHLSRLKNIGMEHPGRNFFISISYQFNQPLKSTK